MNDLGIQGLLDLIKELTAERDALQGEVEMWKATANAVVDFDAVRYRWLREENNTKHSTGMNIATDRYGIEWDDLIDAAMAKETPCQAGITDSAKTTTGNSVHGLQADLAQEKNSDGETK